MPLHTIQQVKYRQKSSFGQYIISIIPAIAAGLIMFVVKLSSADNVEKIYSQGLFPIISAVVSFFGGLFPFSLSGLIWAFLVVFILFMVIRLAFLLIRGKNRKKTLFKYFCGALQVASVILLLFVVTCAPNYYRLTFADMSGLVIRKSSVQELYDLCESLIEEANSASITATIGSDKTNYTVKELSLTSLEAFNNLHTEYEFISKARSKPKPFLFSEILSIFNLSGFYFPYTGEANINANMPLLDHPFTMCHELAHTSGFMREDEANYIAFLACRSSENPNIRFSGMVNSLNICLNAMYSTDRDKYWELRSSCSDKVESYFQESYEYWQPYQDTTAASVSTTVNDIYLRSNAQQDGTKSYGRMVDLMLADYRKTNNID